MLYKSRTKSNELVTLEILNNRMKLSRKDKQHYLNLKKGYEGEVVFDKFTNKLQCDSLILNDLTFEVNDNTFQIDSLIILLQTIFLYEVKNFEGDFYYESDKLFKKPRIEYINPLHQLSRGTSLFNQLLTILGFKLPIDSSVVFINPNFTLYQAPLDQPIIFSNQVNRHLGNLNTTTGRLTKRHKELADQLISWHIPKSKYDKIPLYDYRQLRKGITCPKCQSFSATINKSNFSCMNCQHIEPLDDAVLRSIKEFTVLFPNDKITTNAIYDWCQMVPERRIRNILLKNLTKNGNRRWRYYELVH